MSLCLLFFTRWWHEVKLIEIRWPLQLVTNMVNSLHVRHINHRCAAWCNLFVIEFLVICCTVADVSKGIFFCFVSLLFQLLNRISFRMIDKDCIEFHCSEKKEKQLLRKFYRFRWSSADYFFFCVKRRRITVYMQVGKFETEVSDVNWSKLIFLQLQ